jgi:hypothetical protein
MCSAVESGTVSTSQLEDFVGLFGRRMPEEVPHPVRQFPLRDRVTMDLMPEARLDSRRRSFIGSWRNCPPGSYEAHDPVRAHLPSA